MKFEIFQEQSISADFRWRLRASNGEPIASSGEGYRNKSDCVHAINLVKGTTESTPVADLTSSSNSLAGLAGGLRHGPVVPLSDPGISATDINRARLAAALGTAPAGLIKAIAGLPKK